MATVNLGVIKPVFKGAYNNSTAYVLDNIVTSGGSSYICILASTGNAVSNTTYWSTLSTGASVSASDLTAGTLPMARLSGTLPALSATNLTAIPAANITGTLPAISGANLTGVSAGKLLQVIYNNHNGDVSTTSTTAKEKRRVGGGGRGGREGRGG